ncbi:RluA family pseudouridine synthase [Oryzomonas sagensis]|uniref:Pseudouridine synthase n=1 Tax=Oryzomonas sagensis TaxID=2603857 RepID=A0ABQ6TR76_9BACT|nr:RluA family pseudouridine synthase [Oryzomonas sagensis]KAB0671425.1 RluA family pseudouridine synthase [Oryzomonas sagensis]
MNQTILICPPDTEPQRLDLYICRELGGETRATVQRLIEAGNVLVDGKTARASLKVKGGERILVEIPPPQPAEPQPEAIPLEVLYEDADLIVINKAAGMVVHPGAGNSSGTLVNALLAHCRDLSGIGGELRPGIVHRLDKDTSGVLVAAKNDRAHQSLSSQFSVHSVKRIYQALIYGSPKEDTGKIEGIIGRHPTERVRLSGKAKSGRHAVTRWRVKERYARVSLVELRLETGRTHQIRVHLSEAGFPLLGDPLYPDGGRFNNLADTQLRKLITALGRQALHAHTLGFIHPTTGEFLEFTTEPPEDMAAVIDYLRKSIA